MTVTNPTLAKFVSALTAVDQIPPPERARQEKHQRRRDRRALESERYRKWVAAEVAYHLSYAAFWAALAARVAGVGDEAALNAADRTAGAMLLATVEDFMAVPILSNRDRKERGVLIRKWANSILTAGIDHQWNTARSGWLTKIGGAA